MVDSFNKELLIEKSSDGPKSLSEAIAKLENSGNSKIQDFKEILEKDYTELRKSLDDLKPYLDDFKATLETEVKKTKNQVEDNVKNSPWVALGAVGLIAFVLGWIFGQRKRD